MLIEMRWPVMSGLITHRDGYTLFSMLCKRDLLEHGEQFTQVLPCGRELLLRVPQPRVAELLVEDLSCEIKNRSVIFGQPVATAIRAANRLYAHIVTVKGSTCDQTLKASVRTKLGHLGVSCAVDVLARRTIPVAGNEIVGYSVRLRNVSDTDSYTVQTWGIGGRRRMGCGVFVRC